MGGYDPYSSSKGCTELVVNAYIKSYFNKSKQLLASVRAGNVIGGGDWAIDRLIPDCIRALANNKSVVIRSLNALRPWQHVLEPLYGYLLLSQKLYEENYDFVGPWNFGPDDNDVKSVGWIVKKTSEIWGDDLLIDAKIDKNLHEAEYLKLDCSKARTILNWKPLWQLDKALEKTIEWYKLYYKNANMIDITSKQIEEYEIGKRSTLIYLPDNI